MDSSPYLRAICIYLPLVTTSCIALLTAPGILNRLVPDTFISTVLDTMFLTWVGIFIGTLVYLNTFCALPLYCNHFPQVGLPAKPNPFISVHISFITYNPRMLPNLALFGTLTYLRVSTPLNPAVVDSAWLLISDANALIFLAFSGSTTLRGSRGPLLSSSTLAR